MSTMPERHDSFYKLVSEMRDAQKEYFRTKNTHILVKSKKLESQVDQALKHYKTIPLF